MKTYDAVVVGGGIAGSVAARYASEQGMKTLLIEKHETPRNKPCSGIQFPYLEKLVGERIPREMLCANELDRVEMVMPDGRVVKGRMKMLNFWRSTFDSWLNGVAARAGAEFCDGCIFQDFREEDRLIRVEISDRGMPGSVRTRYLIAADGLNSAVRRKLRPEDFRGKASAAINYYFSGHVDLDPGTLYMFYNRTFAPLMFAWAYKKDDWWVVGTGADHDPLGHAERFLEYIRTRYALTGTPYRREGFASPMESAIYLGRGNILMTGDAAGLVDLYRGLGMDNAALSGRLAVQAIVDAERTGKPALEPYMRLMTSTIRRTQRNEKRQAVMYGTDEALRRSLSSLNLIKGGLLMLAANQVNRILPPERIVPLPL